MSALSISVVTRTCDRPLFLARVAEKLAVQTFTDFEWLIVDDAGTLKKKDIAALGEIGKVAPKLVPHAATGDRAAAAQSGLMTAKGTYCLIHDDDDFLTADGLALLHQAALDNPDAVGLTGYTARREEHIEDGEIETGTEKGVHKPADYPTLGALARRNDMLTISTLFKRSAFVTAGGMTPDLHVLEDWDLWLRLFIVGDFITVPFQVAVQSLRPHAHGAHANSSTEDHHKLRAKLVNHYLRQDIQSGKPGLGFLMNYPDDEMHQDLSRFLRGLKSATGKLSFWKG